MYEFITVACPSACNSLQELLLALSGDVETNPGPTSKADSGPLDTILAKLTKLEQGQTTVLKEIKRVQEEQIRTAEAISALSTRVVTLENRVSALSKLSDQVNTTSAEAASFQIQLKSLEARCEDAENRMRRSNLIFYGIPDADKESWAESQDAIIDTCRSLLEHEVDQNQIERAHRLGPFVRNRNRPIIVKFHVFKQKEAILRKAFKLKGKDVSIGEDFSPAVRDARRKLLEFGRNQETPFKLRFNRLTIGEKQYQVDNVTGSVKEIKRKN